MKALLQGDFGNSIKTGQPVTSSFVDYFPATLELGMAALLLAVVLGVPLGYLAARNQGRFLDTAVVSGSLLGVVTPVFFLAILLKLVFADSLRLAADGRAARTPGSTPPTSRTSTCWTASSPASGTPPGTPSCHLMLPAIALGTIPLAIIVRITRASVAEVMQRGLRAHRRVQGALRMLVSRRHVLRNALLPVVTTIGLQAGLLFSGAVLTETVFAFNGIGQYLFDRHRAARLPGAAGLHPVHRPDLLP